MFYRNIMLSMFTQRTLTLKKNLINFIIVFSNLIFAKYSSFYAYVYVIYLLSIVTRIQVFI